MFGLLTREYVHFVKMHWTLHLCLMHLPGQSNSVLSELYNLWFCVFMYVGFPGGSNGKASACNVGDQGLILGSGRSPGEGNGNSLLELPGKSYGWRRPGVLRSMGSWRAGHDWVTELNWKILFIFSNQEKNLNHWDNNWFLKEVLISEVWAKESGGRNLFPFYFKCFFLIGYFSDLQVKASELLTL